MALTKAQLVDMNANELILDLDADTSLHASTDDQIDIKIGGADDFTFTANTFTALAGSSIVTPTLSVTSSATISGGAINLAAIDIDGGTDIGAAVVDADLFIIDDGANGTNRKVTAARVKTYMGAEGGAFSVDNLDIDGSTDIGAAIVDADLFIIDDGAGGTNRKTAASRLKTYIGGDAGGFPLTALDIDGGTDIGAAIVDADLFIIDDGAGGTNRKVTASRIKTYIGSSTAADDLTIGDAAITLQTSSGNITIDATANDTDIIFKGTDNNADITMLTLDGSAAGDATFNNQVIVGDGKLVLGSTAVTSTAAELNLLDNVSGLVQADLTKLAAVDASAAELNTTDGVTAGTVIASKVIVTDANKDITGGRNITISGELDAATGDFSGDVDVDGTLETDALSIASTAITTTGAEINLIDGGTARGTTAVATGDGILINDGGTMRMTNVDTVSTYFSSHNVGGANIVTTGALDSGSITSGFGAIDNGTSNIRSATITAETAFVPDAANGATLGTASLEFADMYLHDGGIVYFGADQDVELAHVADVGLTLKTATTSDDTKATLTLQTGDTDIAADDVLGQLHFQAPDEGAGTDAILVAAGIAAISEGDFSASNNATSLVFKTGASEAAVEKMRILSDGKIGIGETAPLGKLHVKSGDSGVSSPDITELVVETASNGGISLLGATDGQVEIAFGDSGDANIGRIAYNNNGNYLATVVNAAEAMRIHSNSVVSFDDGIALGVGAGNNTASNVLDDYEEGTFTPSVVNGAGLDSISYSAQTGAYTKIGNMVMVTFRIGISSASKNSSRLDFTGLPFTSFNGVFEGGAYFSYMNPAFSSTVNANISLYQASNSTKFAAYKTSGANFSGNDINSTSGIDIYITGFYRSA